jgi:hypothetical protein
MSENYRDSLEVVAVPPVSAVIHDGPLAPEDKQEPWDLLCGSCTTVVVHGLSVDTARKQYRDPRGSYVKCQKCGKLNELAQRTMQEDRD